MPLTPTYKIRCFVEYLAGEAFDKVVECDKVVE